jgi:hypothetical protein
MAGRGIALWWPIAVSCAVVGCGGGSTVGQSPRPAAPPAATQPPPAAAVPASGAPAAPGVPDPCAVATTDEINSTLTASLGDGTRKHDEARQIVTCNWTQSSPFGILNIGISLTPGADAYQTNFDLAPAYFDGDPKSISVSGAQQAYLVIKKDQKAWVVGMLVNGKFVLIQVAIDSASAEKSQSLAAQIASRMK